MFSVTHPVTRTRRALAGLILGGLVATATVIPQHTARAQDDILLIGKSALYGAATGLLLGGVTALVVDSNDRGDAVRWGIVLGTFGGFAYGIYKVSRGDEDMFLRHPAASGFGEARDADRPSALFAGRLTELSRPPLAQAVGWKLATRPAITYLGESPAPDPR